LAISPNWEQGFNSPQFSRIFSQPISGQMTRHQSHSLHLISLNYFFNNIIPSI
jgi:hypothetical protein